MTTPPEDPRTWTTRDHRGYASLCALLRERIEANYYTPGKKMPSIDQLRAETGLSRQTVGKALQSLERAGYADRALGHGYYVADPIPAGAP